MLLNPQGSQATGIGSESALLCLLQYIKRIISLRYFQRGPHQNTQEAFQAASFECLIGLKEPEAVLLPGCHFVAIQAQHVLKVIKYCCGRIVTRVKHSDEKLSRVFIYYF